MELEENIRRKELTPAELSKEMVHKAVQVAPAISSASDEKKPQGRKRTYAAPKDEVAQAIGVGTAPLVAAEQHVAAMERYPVLGDPEGLPEAGPGAGQGAGRAAGRGGVVAKRSQESPRAPSPKRCKRSRLWPSFSSI
jgi:hypothetical protein